MNKRSVSKIHRRQLLTGAAIILGGVPGSALAAPADVILQAGLQSAGATGSANTPTGATTTPAQDIQAPTTAPGRTGATEDEPSGQDIVVTGSRIVRDGNNAPTPTTVLSTQDIEARSPTNIADYVTQLPSLGIGNTPRTTTLFANATGGANLLSARDLGVARTLVLLDGRRVVGSGLLPSVDVNLLPQNLVERVDVVTGGASAAYGSDAVAGVINFILDTDFTGLKGSFNFSQTEESDGQILTGDLAYGREIGPRGHLLLSANYYKGYGIAFYDDPRDWFQPGLRLLNNPAWTATNGQPGRIVRFDAGYNSTPGGVINSGPLRGTNFLPGGEVGRFVFGPIQQGQVQAGGTVQSIPIRGSLLPDDEHWSVYGRFAYEILDNVTAIFEASYAGNDTVNWSAIYNRQGAGALTIRRDNPFIPLQTQQAMDQAKVTSFRMNRLFYDLINRPGEHLGQAGYNRRQQRMLAALEGTFLDTGRWRAYYQRGRSDVWYTRDNNVLIGRFNQAIDATTNPSTGGVPGVAAGAPICRSSLTNPTNGCIPLNPFGEGSLGKAAIAYVTGFADGFRTRQDLEIRQDVYSIDAQISPFSTWAGPVSVAGGFEYRDESFTATADAQSLARQWFVGNYQAGGNGYNVKELFGEVLVPLLIDSRFGKRLEANGAVRRTDYSTSGVVTTWKAGLTYDLNEEFRLRGTRSRDIRAPSLNDLFAPRSQFVNAFLDRTQPGSPQVPNVTLSGGNPNLKPEIADTWTAGGIYQPNWIPGLSLSVDWYKIDIRDAIVGVGGQLLIDLCYGFGRPQNPTACESITLAPGSTNLVNATLFTSGINAQNVAVEGIDYEASYRSDLSRIHESLPGALNLRLLVTQRLKDQTNFPGSSVPAELGTVGRLKWKGLLTTSYRVGRSTTTLTTRYLGAGKITNQPETSRVGIPDEFNKVDEVFYFELAQNYRVNIGNTEATIFAVVENLFDRDPEPIPSSGTSFGTGAPYDLLGRSYRAGFRVKI